MTTSNTALNEPLNNSSGWDVPLNNNFTIIDGYLAQTASISVTTANVTLTGPTATPNSTSLGNTQSMLVSLTGTLTGNRYVIFPSGVQGRWTIKNNTNGAFTVTLTTSTSPPGSYNNIVAPQSYSVTVYSDGNNIYLIDDGLLQSNRAASFAAVTATSVTGPITPRVVTGTTSSATQSPNGDTTDVYEINGLSAAVTTFNAPSGTPYDGQKLIIRIVDNGTARAISGWSSSYATIGTTLPTTTTANKYIYIGCIYNANSTKWDVVAVGTQA